MSKSQLVPFCLVGLALVAMTAMVVTFEPKPHSPSAPVATSAPAANDFTAVYDLRLTGTDIVPTSVIPLTTDKVAFFDRLSQQIVTVDTKNKSFTSLPTPPPNTQAVTSSGDTFYALADKLYRLDQDQWQELTPPLETTASFLIKFGDNFYLVGDNSIHKLLLSKHEQYLDYSPWLEASNYTFQPLDVYIDGYIHLATRDGLQRLLRGQLDSKNYPFAANSLYLAADQDYFYLLLPESMQLLVIDQDYRLVTQKDDLPFTQAQFLWLDADIHTAYTLQDQQIWRFSLPTVNQDVSVSDSQ